MREKANQLVVRERQVEDILATFTDITAALLSVPMPLRLLARQLELPDGSRLDLLFAVGNRLLLVELKVEGCRKEFVEQVADYRRQVRTLQEQGELPDGELIAYLLCPSFPEPLLTRCQQANIFAITYDPHQVLTLFYERFRQLTLPLGVKPRNHGLWHLGLGHRILYALMHPLPIQELVDSIGLSKSTVISYLTLLSELGLVAKQQETFALSEAGEIYVRLRDEKGVTQAISEPQAALLRQLIVENPFASGTVHGIFAVVECVMLLARNSYPVPLELLCDYFTLTVGTRSQWQHPKTRMDATLMYVHYAAQLGLLARIGQQVYLTPDGIRFILLLQLHKALKLLDALEQQRPELSADTPPSQWRSAVIAHRPS